MLTRVSRLYQYICNSSTATGSLIPLSSFSYSVKATTPLWTAALAWLLFGERQTPGVQGSLLLIAAGVAVASATELHFDAQGMGAALAAAALLSLQHLYSKRVMRDSGAHHLRLLQLLSALALVPLTPIWMVAEASALYSARPAAGWTHAGTLLAADGALAWLQAVAAFSVLSRVSPLAYAVASAAKRAAVVAASLLLLRNPAPPLNLAGMALAGLGVLAYNRAKLRRREEDAHRPLLPV